MQFLLDFDVGQGFTFKGRLSVARLAVAEVNQQHLAILGRLLRRLAIVGVDHQAGRVEPFIAAATAKPASFVGSAAKKVPHPPQRSPLAIVHQRQLNAAGVVIRYFTGGRCRPSCPGVGDDRAERNFGKDSKRAGRQQPGGRLAEIDGLAVRCKTSGQHVSVVQSGGARRQSGAVGYRQFAHATRQTPQEGQHG